MTVWFTADTHFGHANILKYCERPFETADEMDQAMIRNWREVVEPEDMVFHLGDFSMHGPNQREWFRNILRRLPGEKHLILGNHDRLKPFSYIELGFTTVHTALELHGRKFVLAHDPAIANLIQADQTLLCGHVHNLFKQAGNALNVGVDIWDFKPISTDEINGFLMASSIPPVPAEQAGGYESTARTGTPQIPE